MFSAFFFVYHRHKLEIFIEAYNILRARLNARLHTTCKKKGMWNPEVSKFPFFDTWVTRNFHIKKLRKVCLCVSFTEWCSNLAQSSHFLARNIIVSCVSLVKTKLPSREPTTDLQPFIFQPNRPKPNSTYFRACLHGGGGPQVGEVTRLSI